MSVYTALQNKLKETPRMQHFLMRAMIDVAHATLSPFRRPVGNAGAWHPATNGNANAN